MEMEAKIIGGPGRTGAGMEELSGGFFLLIKHEGQVYMRMDDLGTDSVVWYTLTNTGFLGIDDEVLLNKLTDTFGKHEEEANGPEAKEALTEMVQAMFSRGEGGVH